MAALHVDAAMLDKVSQFLSRFIGDLYVVVNDRTRERFIVGGGDDGSVSFWSQESLDLCASWTIFLTPLLKVVQLQGEDAGILQGCVFCISQEGVIAAVAVDGFQFLFVIPGSSAPLSRVHISDDTVMLVYPGVCARLWDIRAKELRRSMTVEKAEEVIDQSNWKEIAIYPDAQESTPFADSNLISSNTEMTEQRASPVLMDLEKMIRYIMLIFRSTAGEPFNASRLNDMCQNVLGIPPCPSCADFLDSESIPAFCNVDSRSAWSTSAEVSTARALCIISLLQIFTAHEECQTVITFYATSLSSAVGSSYQPMDLLYLCRQWLDSPNNFRQVIRILFDAGVTHLSDDETIALAESWQHDLPILQADAEKYSSQSVLALVICGYLAVSKFALMSISALSDISKSIALYLHDQQSPHRLLAIDLCSRGFDIWQHYVDAMEMLRALFALATMSRKDSVAIQNVGAQARSAVTQIASLNSPLFMTTLAMDILHTQDLDHRKSVMQLVAFLIRKKPLVIYSNLPRLVEAVVKSLDPNSTASRDAVLEAATDILGHVVKTFPTVDFHMTTQRLAVGTSEGAVIMYDLKTATRLYVLEGHKKRPTACSFSPDGRRLVTVSLEEGVVLVWKVGSSFSSFFHPGAPPRQGHGGSQPFKTLTFNVGSDANMTVAESLQNVRFDWSAERSVKLLIRESVLTFST